MNLILQRDPSTEKGTAGKLSVNGEAFCFTLERGPSDPQFPCIPSGKYAILLQYSPHFARLMPHLQDVPGRTEILIHWGNLVSDSEGCILVGDGFSSEPVAAGEFFLDNTRNAFARLYTQLDQAQEAGITIDVMDAAPEAT